MARNGEKSLLFYQDASQLCARCAPDRILREGLPQEGYLEHVGEEAGECEAIFGGSMPSEVVPRHSHLKFC
jgi:hypothetical protein